MNEKIEKHISTYELFARYLPAIITSVPYLLIGFVLMHRDETKDVFSFFISIKFFGYVSMSFVCLYFYSQIIRTTAKHFERKYFHNKRGFPSTYFMLYSDTEYSEKYKDQFRQSVEKVFNFQLCSKNEERENPGEAIRRLNDITKRIILRVGDGVLVAKQNQWYGFNRNLVGGTVFGVIGAIITFVLGWWVFKQPILVYSGACLFFVYGVIFIFRRPLMIQHAESFARQLHAEFMK